MVESSGERRFLGAVWFISAVVSIGWALAVQPIADWQFFGWLLGAVFALVGLVGLWMLVTGKGHVLGDRYSLRTQATIAVVGVVASTLIIIVNLLIDEGAWTAQDILTVGVWVALGFMFVISIYAIARAAEK